MRIFFTLLAFAGALHGQTHALQICDLQVPRHCWTATAPANATLSPLPTKLWGKSGALLVGLDSTDLNILPGAIISADAFVSVSGATNAAVISLAATPSTGGADVSVAKTGSGPLLPLRFWRAPDIVGQWNTSNQFLIGLNSTDVSSGLGSLVAGGAIISVTATTNASVGSFAAVAGSYVALAANRTGSGAYLPLIFATNATERARIQVNGVSLFGLTSTDVSALAGAIVTGDVLVSATAATDASIASLKAVAGSYVALASSKTGSGTYLPMTFSTSGSERMRILTGGNVGIGTSSPGTLLDVNGATTTVDLTVTGTCTGCGSSQWLASGSDIYYSAGTVIAGALLPGALSLGGHLISNGTTVLPGAGWGQVQIIGSDTQAANKGGVLNFAGNYIGTTNIADFAALAGAKENSTSGNYAGYLAFYTRTNGSSTAERMRIDSVGNVAIGTTSPGGYALNVIGSVNASTSFVTGSGGGLTLSATGLSAAASGSAFTVTGSSSSNGNIILTPGAVVSNASVTVNAARTDQPALIVNNISGTTTAGVFEVRDSSSSPVFRLTGNTNSTNPNVLITGLASTDVSAASGAIVSGNAFVSATATTNASVGSFAAIASNYVALSASRSGSGTYLPFAFFTNGSERARIQTDGVSLFGLTSTDASLSAGAIVLADALVTATAATNATIGSFKAVASNYVAIASSKTGSGTYQPLALFTSGAERARILTGGNLLVGRTTDDGSGAILQSNAAISALHFSSTTSGLPTIAGTGCSMTSGSTDTRGGFSCTGVGATTITFATAFVTAPFCVVNDTLSNTAPSARSTTSFSFTTLGVGANSGSYVCIE